MLLIFVAIRDASYLFSYPVAVGADGYYYVLQINELLKTHHLYYPSNTPIVFWILAALTFVTKNAVVAIKLGSIIVSMQALDNVDVILTAQGSVDGVRSDQSVKKRSRKPLQDKQVAL